MSIFINHFYITTPQRPARDSIFITVLILLVLTDRKRKRAFLAMVMKDQNKKI